jgi:outer membrane protein assembly factor BamA
LLEGESKLYDLGIFDWSSVGPRRPIQDQTEEEALVKVHESKRNTITYGFGFEVSKRGGNLPTGTVAVPGLPAVGINTSSFVSSEKAFASPRGTIEFTRRNIRGVGETGAVSLLLARLDQRALATYADPHFRGLKWRSLFSMSGEHTTENPLFAATLGDVSFQLERTIDRKGTTTAQFRYDFNHTVLSQILVPELVLPQDRSVRLSTFSASIIQDTRDKPLDPRTGHYSTLDLGITPTALGSSANFTRLVGQYASYRPVGPIKMVWANSIRLGLAAPFAGSFVPTSQRFFAGGGTTLRGFPINGAGPQRLVAVCNPGQTTNCSQISVPFGGNQLFILNSELRYPIPIINNLGGVLFYDGGNVYSHIRFSDFVEHYTSTVGIGFRYSTPVGPVRIDVGRNLNPIPGINPFQFFITLGQAF